MMEVTIILPSLPSLEMISFVNGMMMDGVMEVGIMIGVARVANIGNWATVKPIGMEEERFPKK